MTAEEYFAIEIPNGVKVCVPPDVSLMTPYILLEQEDWFEDEIKFLRKYLRPGMRVIDIGVNYGTYFLTAAKKIGDNGKIWGFEPSTQCCSYVNASIELNGFKNTELVQAGLSNRIGTAFLSLCDNTELNTVADSISEDEMGESIELLSLDHCLHEFDLKGIEFVKMDAEGEENNIIKGGVRFFEQNSPLVMFELKHGDTVNKELIGEFNSIGYQTYKLVPGLNILAPFSPDDQIDAFQLNLFSCKSDCADSLSRSGYLVGREDFDISQLELKGVWKKFLLAFPYFRDLAAIFGDDLDRSTEQEFRDYYRALDLFAHSKTKKCGSEEKYAALVESRKTLERLMAAIPSTSVALSLTRVLVELGLRHRATNLLSHLGNAIQSGDQLTLPTPFLAPLEKFDRIPIKGNLEAWLYSSIFTSHHLMSAFSSYYISEEVLQTVRAIDDIGTNIPEIKRRRLLLGIRSSLPNEDGVAQVGEFLTMKKQNIEVWKKLVRLSG